MKSRNYLAILLIVLLSSFYNHQSKKKILFFGDSITQMGVGPKGYISRIGQLLNETPDGKNVELIGAGIGGNKVYDLYLRMEDDVLAKNPDVVVIWVGVNDVWHKRTSVRQPTG